MADKEPDWGSYEIRTGKDGKPGIYLRDYNVRLAVFNSNTFVLQQSLAKLFDRHSVSELKRAGGRPINAMKAANGKPRRFRAPR